MSTQPPPSQGMLSWLYSEESGQAVQAAASNTEAYGATENEGPKKTYEWESRGSPLTLSMEVASVMGKQVIALSMIVLQVSYSKKYIMDCDDRIVGLPTALACEWTKTYVRLFPLIAVVVSLMAASRFLLHHRIFYELLRHGSLLNFSNFAAYRDPLFLILVWCLVNACMHFVLELWTHHHLDLFDLKGAANEITKDAAFQAELNKVIFFYMAPSAVFMAFLFASYDTESQLVPLSKYIEEDPDEMRRIVATMPVLEEEDVSRAVERGLPFQRQAEPCMATEAYAELFKECGAEQDRVREGKDMNTDSLGSWRMVGTQWPARILLDARLCDEKSVQFRYTWYAFSIISMAVIGFVFVTFVLQAFKDVKDVVEGQRPDIAALIMEVIFSTFSAWLAYNFARTAFVPCTSASSMK